MNKILVKTAAAAAVSVMAVSALAGCGANGGSGESEKLVMGTNAAFPPFEYTTSQGLVGEFDGIDVAISKEIADSIGKTLEVADMEFDGLIAAVSTGKVDMVAAGMTATEERAQSVDFSDTYYVASQVIVVAPDNTDITKAEDLKNNKKVGVVLGYTGDGIVTDDLEIAEDKITRANRGLDVVQDVKNGKLDAVVIDSATGKALADKNGLKIIEDKEAFESEEYAIAVKKGNKELLNSINAKLNEMKSNGTIEKLAMEYDEKLSEGNE